MKKMTIAEKLDIYNKKNVAIKNDTLIKLKKKFEKETGMNYKPGLAVEWAIKEALK